MVSFKVMSLNVRVDQGQDGEDGWEHRRDAMGEMWMELAADFVGAQEATPKQIDDIMARVKGYAWTGRARDNAESPEYCPIFYREERWHLSDYGTFWLSPQPNRMGLGWDAACVRIATWGKFRDGRKGNTVFVINTHLDHEGPEARVNGAAMIVQNMKDLAKGLPAILTGDFNCEPGSQAYETVTAAGLVDAHAGKWGKTFVGFARYPVKPIQIDYVFCNDKVKVLNADTVPAERNGRRMSDHRAIWADVAV